MEASDDQQLLPFAHPIDLVRAHQKDEECRGRLRKHTCEALEEVLGHRRAGPWLGCAAVLADCAYAWALASGRTLGEEYCELLPVEPGGLLGSPRAGRRLAAALLAVLPLALLQHLLDERTDASSGGRRGGALSLFLRSAAQAAMSLLRVHLALFYFLGSYRRLSDRLVGVRFVSLSARPFRRYGYAPLGALLLLQVTGQAIASYLTWRRARRAKDPAEATAALCAEADAQRPSKGLRGQAGRQPTCHICMCTADCATATPCGHVFCWECIASWCAIKASCPLCRTGALPQQLLPLLHYEVTPKQPSSK